MKVLNFGSLNIDFVYKVRHTVRPGETLSSKDLMIHAGGKGANQSAALAKAGIPVFHAGKIGNDGRWLLEKLKKFGVNTDLVTVSDGKTGNAIIQVSDNGENAIVLYGGGNKEISREEITQVLQNFKRGDMLLLQNEISNIPFIMETARKTGMKIVFNPAPFEEKILSYPLDFVDIFIVNETEGSGLSQGENIPEKIVDTLTETYRGKDIILTIGKNGVLYGKDTFRAAADIIDVPVVDTTAAGDTFIGYFIAGLLHDRPIEELLRFSCIASSLTVSKPGAMDAIPLLDGVLRLL